MICTAAAMEEEAYSATSPAITEEPIERTRMGPRKHAFDGEHIGATPRIQRNNLCGGDGRKSGGEGTPVSPIETDQPIEILFGVKTRENPRKYVLDVSVYIRRVHIGAIW